MQIEVDIYVTAIFINEKNSFQWYLQGKCNDIFFYKNIEPLEL